MKLTATLFEEPRDDNVPFIIAPVEVIDVAVEVAAVGAVAVGEVTIGVEADAALNVHQPGELLKFPVRDVPIVSRFGKSAVVATHQICCPATIPDTLELVILRYKSYSLAAPLETGVPATVPVVFPPAAASELIVIANDFVAVVLLLSVTLKVAEVAVQVAVGLPEIVPAELSVNPAGNVPELIDQV